jgi:hypothetical protein
LVSQLRIPLAALIEERQLDSCKKEGDRFYYMLEFGFKLKQKFNIQELAELLNAN